MITLSLQTLSKAGLALIAGGFLALAFAPIAFYPFAIVCPAILLFTWLNSTPRRAFFLGLYFGIGFFSVGVSWVFISIHVFGHSSVLLSLLITAFFIFILALFPAIQGYLFKRFFPESNWINYYFVFPSLWTLAEWLRSWIFTGFPWLLLGTSQVNSPLAGYAPLVGVFGVTFLVLLNAALLLTCICNKKHFLLPLIILIVLWSVGYSLTLIQWTRKVGNPIQVSLIQANISQEIKWQPESLQTSLISYLQLTESHWNSRLIIWPEAAIPLLQQRVSLFLDQLDIEAKQHGVTLITGIPMQKGFQYYNGMIALGLDHASYQKQRLVIFGEYLPWWISWAQGLLNVLDIPMSNFSAGSARQTPFQVAGFTLGTFICYEIAYPHLVRKTLPHAQMLLTINDDAWFGHSFALAQHRQIGQFQALATGRYLLFLSNTGITAIITPQGKIQAQLPPFQIGVLTDTVYKTTGNTPWSKLGDCPSIIFLVGLTVLCYVYSKKPRVSRRH